MKNVTNVESNFTDPIYGCSTNETSEKLQAFAI